MALRLNSIDALFEEYLADIQPQSQWRHGDMPVPYRSWYQPEPEAQPFDWGALGQDILTFSPIKQAIDAIPSMEELNEQLLFAARGFSGFPTEERSRIVGQSMYELFDASMEPYMSDEEIAALPPEDPRRDAIQSLVVGAAELGAGAAVKAGPTVGREMLGAAPDFINTTNRRLGLPEIPFENKMIMGRDSLTDAGLSDELVEIAEDAERRGLSREKIFDATGLWRGPDRQWRFEVSDDQARLAQYPDELEGYADFGSELSMNEVLEHPLLEEADIISSMTRLKPQRGGGGGYYRAAPDPQTLGRSPMITAGVDVDDEEFLETLLHELQHGQQEKHSFARGGHWKQFDREASMQESAVTERMGQLLDELANTDVAKLMEAAGGDEAVLKDIRRTYPEEVEGIERMMENFSLTSIQGLRDEGLRLTEWSHMLTPEGKYHRLYGEVESRNVERRRRYDPDYRRMRPPWSTEDVGPDDVLLRLRDYDLGVAASTGRDRSRSPVGMLQLADDAPLPPLRPEEEGVLSAIRRDVTASIDPRSGSPLEGRRGQASAPWRATSGSVGADELDNRVGSLAARSFTLDDKYATELQGLGRDTPVWTELNKQPAAAKYFREQIQSAKDALGSRGSAVDVYDSYKGLRLFVNEDGSAGFAIKDDGDVVSVFNNSTQRGIVPQMVMLATQEGGRKLDAFDTILPHFYNRAGYQDVATLAWNDEYAPPNWDYETMQRPGVTSMVYSPEGAVRGYSPSRASMVEDYDTLLEAQNPEIFAPEMTPGVTRQLHHAVPRADQRRRVTVRDPQRQAYPEIYAPRREQIEAGAEMIAPESPSMEELFGVTRRDLDDMTYLMQPTHTNVDIPVWQTTDRGGLHTLNVMTPANEMRLQDTLALAAADPRFAGSYGWYLTHPLLQRFIGELGPELGNRRFYEFMQIGSALSSGSAVPQEIKRASEAFRQLISTGDLRNFTRGDLPPGYGHIYHGTAHRSQLETLQDTGQIFTPESILASPKTPTYMYSKTGENLLHPTQDAHFVRGTGLVDVRPTADTGSIGATEAGRMRDWFSQRVAEPLGMRGSPAQALLWNVLAPATGVKTQVGKPFLELFSDAVVREAKRTGKSANDVLVDFMHGRGRLAGTFGAAVSAGLLSEVEQPEGDI